MRGGDNFSDAVLKPWLDLFKVDVVYQNYVCFILAGLQWVSEIFKFPKVGGKKVVVVNFRIIGTSGDNSENLTDSEGLWKL